MRNKKLEIAVKVYLANIFRFMENVQDEEFLTFILKNLIETSDLLFYFRVKDI